MWYSLGTISASPGVYITSRSAMIADSEIGTARVPFAGADIPSEAVISTCVHCGLCLSSCPTYRETGLEMFSPRGRIYLMKAVADGRIGLESDVFQEQMSACLNCRACEAVCPSGVEYGQILEASRTQIEQARADGRLAPQGQTYPAAAEPARYHVALLAGCIMSTAFANVHAATIRVLQKNGCEVLLPPDQGCCGALHVHGGDMDGGRELARRNIAAFEGLGLDAIIVNAAGCGSTMKEYGHLLHDDPAWAERAKAFAAKVKDVTEFLGAIELNTRDLKPVAITVTYQEPCHLAHAQRISAQPRALLRAIPGLILKEMHESSLCCGSAGIYNITEPEMAARLGNRKLDNAEATSADILVTANPGCHIQLAGGLRRRGSAMRVRHIVEVLDQAYRGDA